MMARATRSTTADLKRKRSADNIPSADKTDAKQQRTEQNGELDESAIDCTAILHVLDAEDKQDLLDRVFPLPDSDTQASLRALLSTTTPVSVLKSAINHLRPISSHRARQSQTAEQQLRFCNLALSLVEQVPPSATHFPEADIFEPSSPQRPKPGYALVQHLPSGDWWTSATSSKFDPSSLQTGNAELVAILPTPSSSSTDKPITTIGSYCVRPPLQKRYQLAPRKVTTGAYLDYGIYSNFAPTFDHDGENIGRRELGEVLWYKEEKKRLRDAARRERVEGTGSIVDVTPEEPTVAQDASETSTIPDDDLEALVGPEEVAAIKAALNDLEMEKSVQQLLERNQRALVRLGELQKERLTKHPMLTAEEGSEEWDTAQAILDSLTLLAALRPRSSSQEAPAIIPSPTVLHKLHRTLALEPSPGWYGTLPSGRTTALRDDSTVKIGAATATPAPVATTTTVPAPTPVPSTNAYAGYAYNYAAAQQGYRPPATPYAAYKPGQAASHYPNYSSQQQQGYYAQQSYASATANQQPYGATTAQQPYAGYSAWYGQYPTIQSGAGGSGRGTPQPTPLTGTTSYTNFFNSTTSAAATPTSGSRTPAVANTVVATPAAVYGQVAGTVPTLPVHLRPAMPTNGATGYQQQSYFGNYQAQTQPAT